MSESGPPPVPRRSGAEPRGSRPPRPARPPRARRPRPARAGLLAVLLLLFLGVGALALSLLGGSSAEAGGRVRVAIPPGAGVGEIADRLERQELVSSSLLFEARTTVEGHRDDLKPGVYALPRDAGYGRIVAALSAGPPPRVVPVVNVTIPEGHSRREAARVVAEAELRGSYTRATVRSPALRPRRYGAPSGATLEGFLFPATYEVRRSAPARSLVRKQLLAFRREFAKVDMGQARRRNLTEYDVLTIASMVEREAQVARERRLVASVMYNRLRDGMPLGIDATVRYATRNWSRPLTQSQLAIDSPYNTRVRAGLPPGPIGSPGLASIRAAARPARTGYRYYVVKPGTCGEHEFSESADEAAQATARYNEARAAAGGRSPTTC